MARRVTAEHANILVQTSDTVAVRVTAIHTQFLLDVNSRVIADNLNSWADAVQIGYFSFAAALSVTVSDTINNWVDGINQVLLPDGPIEIQVNSLNTFNIDSIVIGTGHAFTDTLSMADAAAVAVGISIEAFDSMFFNIGDSIEISGNAAVTISVSDTLNAWLDAVITNNAGNPIPPLSDAMNMSDGVALRMNHFATFSDTLSLSDLAVVVLGIFLEVSDTNSASWNDSVIVATTIRLTIDVGDALSMSDAASTLSNTALTNYLRRYLNDVVN